MSGCLSYCLKRGTGGVETPQKTHDGELRNTGGALFCWRQSSRERPFFEKSLDGELRNTGGALFCFGQIWMETPHKKP